MSEDRLTREVLIAARDAVLASCPCGGDPRHDCHKESGDE